MAKKSEKKPRKQLPYRRCVGICVFNAAGRVFVGSRSDRSPELLAGTHEWQMPQGGINKGEDAYEAALRELREETNITSVASLGRIKGWLRYDLPPDAARTAWKGRYRGQKQKWFALAFTGDDSEIDILTPAGGHKPEFRDWTWVRLEETIDLVIPFKRDVYRHVIAAFAPLAPAGG